MTRLATAGIFALLVAASTPAAASEGAALPDPVACDGCWLPPQHVSWQWQLQGKVDLSVRAKVFDVDLFDVPAKTVDALHDKGRHMVCYLDAGTWERWRPDADDFPGSVKGETNGWPGERWLDVRRLDVLGPIMKRRLHRCAAKGFDAVEFDNVDGYANETGFPLTAKQQLRFDVWLANQAHRRGLAAALKNDLEQVPKLLEYFDFALDEQCFQYHECWRLKPFVADGKAVFEVEYELARKRFCTKADDLGFSSMRKRYALGVWRRPCP